MIVYDGLKTDFLESCEKDTIAIEIEENILSNMGRQTPTLVLVKGILAKED